MLLDYANDDYIERFFSILFDQKRHTFDNKL